VAEDLRLGRGVTYGCGVSHPPRSDRVRGDASPAVGGAFYDEGVVFETYVSAVDAGPSSANYVMEEPALLDALGDVQGLRVLDLGCGNAAIGHRLLDAGCDSYVGIDGSAKMVEAARVELLDTSGEVRRSSIEEFSAPADTYDMVVSRMALHYVEDLGAVLSACHACLSRRGRMVFSVVHPVVSSHDARASSSEQRTNWLVDDYFATGPREQDWMGGRVLWHHRTVEQYVVGFQNAGFALTALSECAPRRDRFASDDAEYARRRRIPLFLLLAGRRS
jgi:SAM-dependent methyltransferase